MGKAGGTMTRCFVSRWHQQPTCSGPGWTTHCLPSHSCSEQWQGESMQVVPRDRPQIRWVCPRPPKVHPSKENPQQGIKKLNRGTDGHGALKQNVSAYSWNEGRCAYHPYWQFWHVCAIPGCQGEHRAVDCRRQARCRQGEMRRESQPKKTR